MFINILILILKILVVVVPVLIAVAYFTLVERKVISTIQRRNGPNVVGVYGLLQPLSDGLKLFVKETVLPSNIDIVLFILAPILTFIISILSWAVIPLGEGMFYTDINLGILYLLAVSSLGVYGIIIAGWSSNSKYAFLGALRSTAQMISYEVTMGFIILSVIVVVGSFNLIKIVEAQANTWFCIPLFPLFLMFFISGLAETNRHPFDLPEAEAELVSGYNVEYSAMGFALFFLGEYSNMLAMSSFTTILFLGGWYAPFDFLNFLPGSFWFGIKISFFVVLFILARAILPRYRYDQLMRLGWKVLLPSSLAYLIFVSSLSLSSNWIG
jgi:NADH-quinone oxidoreductase subunit H